MPMLLLPQPYWLYGTAIFCGCRGVEDRREECRPLGQERNGSPHEFGLLEWLVAQCDCLNKGKIFFCLCFDFLSCKANILCIIPNELLNT